ncbi:MAG: undecaprenyl-diphosphate phosphatase, partial [Anaerobacillus sp.]
LIVGLSQAVALIPGISRSGATVVTSLAMGMNRETAFRFSFLLYLPVSLGGVIMSWTDLFHNPASQTLFVPYLVAFILSVVATYVAFNWFKQIVMNGKLGYFTVYCLSMGVFVLIAAQF